MRRSRRFLCMVRNKSNDVCLLPIIIIIIDGFYLILYAVLFLVRFLRYWKSFLIVGFEIANEHYWRPDSHTGPVNDKSKHKIVTVSEKEPNKKNPS